MNAADVQKVAAVTAKLTGAPTDGYLMPTPVPARKKLLRRIFPRQHVPVPENAGHYMRTFVDVHLDWKDRLRTLVSGHVIVETITEMDVPVTRTRSKSTVSVVAPGETV
jgi:hypothetical protein